MLRALFSIEPSVELWRAKQTDRAKWRCKMWSKKGFYWRPVERVQGPPKPKISPSLHPCKHPSLITSWNSVIRKPPRGCSRGNIIVGYLERVLYLHSIALYQAPSTSFGSSLGGCQLTQFTILSMVRLLHPPHPPTPTYTVTSMRIHAGWTIHGAVILELELTTIFICSIFAVNCCGGRDRTPHA